MSSSSSGARERNQSGIYAWLDERLDIESVKSLALKKTVPQHKHAFWYYWGGISLFLFLVQLLTGILLLVYYRPGREAFESVRQITYDVDFGWLVRSAHSWAANLMVLAVFIHMFSVMLMKAYRKPREFGWWSGLFLLTLTMVFGFSGYLLPMDDLAYFATKVGLEIPKAIPILGPMLVTMVQGGDTVTDVTIQRFFALHVVVLPLLFIATLGFHVWLVQLHGMAVPPSEESVPESKRYSIPFFPNFLAKDLAMWLIALNVVAILASMFPWSLGQPADPASPAPAGIHPEWYFMSQFQVLKVFGRWFPGVVGEYLGIGLFALVGILLALIPLYDQNSKAAMRARSASWFALMCLFGIIIFTVWGYMDL